MTPNGEHEENGPVHFWRRVKILTPHRLCENPQWVTHAVCHKRTCLGVRFTCFTLSERTWLLMRE